MDNFEKVKELYKDFKTLDDNGKDDFVLWLLEEYGTYLDIKKQIPQLFNYINY